LVSIDSLIAFCGALVIIYALPGPDMALILTTSARSGWRAGLTASGGLAIARTAHVTLSACGIAALIQHSPWVYNAVRYGGALYLAYVAVQIFRSPAFVMKKDDAEKNLSSPAFPLFMKGMLTSLLNPKALLFCSVLLPQFIKPSQGSVMIQMVELGALLVIAGAIFDATYAIGASRISNWLAHHPSAQTVQRWTFSAALLGFALRLSLD